MKENPMNPTLSYHDKIAVLNLGDGENRFAPEFLDAVNLHLDTALSEGVYGVVTTAAGKFYSNGLDLDWMSANGKRAEWYVQQVQTLFARILTLPLPTAAALPGHAFGAGAMLALAHDYRVMRADRGFFCLPEVDIRIPFSTGMAALVQAKVPVKTAVAAMTTGRRFGGREAQQFDLVDATAVEDAVIDSAIELLTPLGGKDHGTLGAIKQTMFAQPVGALMPS
jgi:Delta3-Delta2-enoyl-CoA isomerase